MAFDPPRREVAGDRTRPGRWTVNRVVVEVVLAVAGVAVVLGLDPTAASGPLGLVEADDTATPIVLSGSTTVDRWQVTDDVWVLTGEVTVRGRVDGDVTVLRGRTRVDGSVTGDVTVVRGGATVGPEAVIGGRLRTSDPPAVQPTATVHGGAAAVGPDELPHRLVVVAAVLGGLLAAGVVCLLGAADEIAGRVIERPVEELPPLFIIGLPAATAVFLAGGWEVALTVAVIVGPGVLTVVLRRLGVGRRAFTAWAASLTLTLLAAIAVPALALGLAVLLTTVALGALTTAGAATLRRRWRVERVDRLGQVAPEPVVGLRRPPAGGRPERRRGSSVPVASEPTPGWSRRMRRAAVIADHRSPTVSVTVARSGTGPRPRPPVLTRRPPPGRPRPTVS